MTPTPTCEASPSATGIAGWLTPRAQVAFLTCACAGGSAFLFAVDPSRHAVYPQCVLYRATGLYCAGCGATRALYALLHGDILTALHDNALFVAALPFLMGSAGFYLLQTWRRNSWPSWQPKPGTILARAAVIFLVMAAFMVARNLPGPPFDLLKPLAG